MQAAQPVDLTAELAEVLRWREMEWSRIPPLSRKLVMPYLGAGDTINLDTAVTNKEDRKHLVKAYVGLRSAGLDGYAHYDASFDGVCLGVRWAQKRSIDLRNFRLEYWYEKEDQDWVLCMLVRDKRKELATYFATRCNVRDKMYYYNTGSNDTSTLIMASEHGYLEIVQTLLGRGADVHGSNFFSNTALHLASWKGHIEVVRALLEAGADVRRAGRNGRLPISLACEGEHMEVFRALVEAGGDVNTPYSNGGTALHFASLFGFTEGVRYLVERGADVNMSDTGEYGYTPLTVASSWGEVEVVRALLEAGADANKRDGGGRSPLCCALKEERWDIEEARQGKPQVAALLREAGAQELQPHELENL